MSINKNAQAWALSACLISEIAVTKVIDKLTESDFTAPELKDVFLAISSLFSKSKNIGIGTVMAEMERLGFKYDTGWFNEFGDLVLSDAHVDDHIEIILNESLKLKAKKITAEINNKLGANEDISDTIDYAREEFMGINANDENLVFTPEEAVIKAVNQTQEMQANPLQVGLQTDIYELNKMVIFKKQDVVVVAAKKSVGKSALLSQIVLFNARKGKKGAMILLEGTVANLTSREISRISRVDFSDIMMGRMNKEQMSRYQEASEIVAKYPILISTKRGLTFPQIQARLRTFKNKLGRLDWIVIDYIQKIRTPRGHSRQRELADLSEEFSTMAQDFDCPVFIGSQVNHEGITREAEDLENDADVVLKLRRQVFEYRSKFNKGNSTFPQKDGDKMPEDYATLQITKNKNGKTGGIELRSMLEFQMFEDWNKYN